MVAYASHPVAPQQAPLEDPEQAHADAISSLLGLISQADLVRSWREGDDSATFQSTQQLAAAVAKLTDASTVGSIESVSNEPQLTFTALF